MLISLLLEGNLIANEWLSLLSYSLYQIGNNSVEIIQIQVTPASRNKIENALKCEGSLHKSGGTFYKNMIQYFLTGVRPETASDSEQS